MLPRVQSLTSHLPEFVESTEASKFGRTDSHGGLPETEAYTREDLAAMISHSLGIGPDREFHDPTGRLDRVYRGEPIRPLL